MDEEQLEAALTAVRGIGVWTVHMHAMFHTGEIGRHAVKLDLILQWRWLQSSMLRPWDAPMYVCSLQRHAAALARLQVLPTCCPPETWA